MGIDDFAIKKGACRKHPGDCSFEGEGLCSWYNLKNDDFDWLLHQGPTPSTSTGPSVDHTYNDKNGTFIYIETSAPRKRDQKAWIASETLRPTNNICFNFWYHAYGSSIGYYAYVNSNYDGQLTTAIL